MQNQPMARALALGGIQRRQMARALALGGIQRRQMAPWPVLDACRPCQNSGNVCVTSTAHVKVICCPL